jgi:hypothetical protein
MDACGTARLAADSLADAAGQPGIVERRGSHVGGVDSLHCPEM